MTGLLLADVHGDAQLRHENASSGAEHALLPRGQWPLLVLTSQIPHHLSHLVDVAGLELGHVVLEAPRPVQGHVGISLGQGGQHLRGLLRADDLPHAHLVNAVDGD